MSNSKRKKQIKMHFVWVEKELQDEVELRKLINKSSEQGKINLSHHLALNNIFLLKRNYNVCFANVIYQKLIDSKDKFDEVLREISKIILDHYIDAKAIKESLNQDYLRTEIFTSEDTLEDFFKKAEKTNKDSITYIEQRWEDFIEEGDLESMIAAEALLREYIAGSVQYEILFSKSQLYDEIMYPQHFEYCSKSFSILNIKNYRLYQEGTRNFPFYLENIKRIYAEPIQDKLINLLKSVFEYDEESEAFGEYNVLFNRILSIASKMYFRDLPQSDKINLLNQKYDLETMIINLEESTLIKEFKIWAQIVDDLIEYSFYELGLKLSYVQLDNINNLKVNERIIVYELLGKLYKHLGRVDESLNYFFLAYDYSKKEKISDGLLKIYILNEIAELPKESLKERKIKDILNEIVELSGNILLSEKKFDAFFRLSKTYRVLRDYENERLWLNKAIDLGRKDRFKNEEIYIEKRIQHFLKTKMNSDQLYEIDLQEQFMKLVSEAFECFHHLYLKEAINFFGRALNFLKKHPQVASEVIIHKSLGFLYLYFENFKESLTSFNKALVNIEDKECSLYNCISLWKLGEKAQSIKSCQILDKIFEISLDEDLVIFDYWLINLINFLGITDTVEFIDNIKYANFNYKLEILINFGIKYADFGFFEVAISCINSSLLLCKTKDQKARCYNIIGSIMANKDEHKDALKNYFKAIELKEDYILCYQNIGRSYMNLQDFQNAKVNLSKALEFTKPRDYPRQEIYSIRMDLEYCNRYVDVVFNTHKISSENVRSALVSAERIYLHFIGKNDLLDASSIINSYSKALEIMLHEQVSPFFKDLLNKYRKRYFERNVSESFHFKFGNLFRKKTVNLGSWKNMIDDFKGKQDSEILEEFRKCLLANLENPVLEQISKACKYLTALRNPLSHRENISMENVMLLRIEIISILNPLIDSLYNLKNNL